LIALTLIDPQKLYTLWAICSWNPFTIEKVRIIAAILMEVAAIDSLTIKLVLVLLFWKLILFAISKAVFKRVYFSQI
jgi:hypothetical protein